MAKHMTPQQQLEHACSTLDPDLACQALAAGADANRPGPDNCPLPIEVLRATPAQARAKDRAALLELLFAAGAELDPRWAEDVETTPSAGLEILIDQAVSRSAEDAWSINDELVVLDAWIAAGNSPKPLIMVDGRAKLALDLLSFMLENMKDAAMATEETENALDFLRASAAVLAAAQDPVIQGPLLRACFEPEDIQQVLAHHAMWLARRQEEALETSTAPAPRRGISPVRL